jgi:hypothetical protein
MGHGNNILYSPVKKKSSRRLRYIGSRDLAKQTIAYLEKGTKRITLTENHLEVNSGKDNITFNLSELDPTLPISLQANTLAWVAREKESVSCIVFQDTKAPIFRGTALPRGSTKALFATSDSLYCQTEHGLSVTSRQNWGSWEKIALQGRFFSMRSNQSGALVDIHQRHDLLTYLIDEQGIAKKNIPEELPSDPRHFKKSGNTLYYSKKSELFSLDIPSKKKTHLHSLHDEVLSLDMDGDNIALLLPEEISVFSTSRSKEISSRLKRKADEIHITSSRITTRQGHLLDEYTF